MACAKKIVLLMLALLLVLVACSAGAEMEDNSMQGKKYYVSPAGDDANDGLSPETPFKTPQFAADQTAPGDIVYFMDGVFEHHAYSNMLNIRNSGEEDAYITYTAYEGAHPILKAYGGWNHILVCGSYIRIENLTIDGISSEEMIEQGKINYEEAAAAADEGRQPDWNKMSVTNTNGITIGGRDVYQQGYPLVHHVEVRGCTIGNCPGVGVFAAASDYITFENNEVFNNCWPCMYAPSGISVLGLQDIDDNRADYKIIIRGNRVHDNVDWVKWLSTRDYSDGNGIIIDSTISSSYGDKPYQGRILVTNNVVYGNGGSGIHAFHSAHVDIVNNTVYNNSVNPFLMDYGQLFANKSYDVLILNNIIYGRAGKPLIWSNDTETVLFAHNIFYNAFLRGDVNLYNNVVKNPRFIDPENGDFRLEMDSPAIDQGLTNLAPAFDIDGTARPQGAGIDIGAYESSYTSSAPAETQTINLADFVTLEEAQGEEEKESLGSIRLTADNVDGVFQLNWDAFDSADSYAIYDGAVLLGKTTDTMFSETDVPVDVVRSYQVVALQGETPVATSIPMYLCHEDSIRVNVLPITGSWAQPVLDESAKVAMQRVDGSSTFNGETVLTTRFYKGGTHWRDYGKLCGPENGADMTVALENDGYIKFWIYVPDTYMGMHSGANGVMDLPFKVYLQDVFDADDAPHTTLLSVIPRVIAGQWNLVKVPLARFDTSFDWTTLRNIKLLSSMDGCTPESVTFYIASCEICYDQKE